MFPFEPTEPTTELFLPRVLSRTDCDKHNVPEGLYCFYNPPLEGDKWIGGVCNSRARRAGFTGKISDQAMQVGTKSRRSPNRWSSRKPA